MQTADPLRFGYPYARLNDNGKVLLLRVVDLVRRLSATADGPAGEVLDQLQRAAAVGDVAVLLMANHQCAARVTDSTKWVQARGPSNAEPAPVKHAGTRKHGKQVATAKTVQLSVVSACPDVQALRGAGGAFDLLRRLFNDPAQVASLDDAAHPAARLAVCQEDAEVMFPSLGEARSFWDKGSESISSRLAAAAPGAGLDVVLIPVPAAPAPTSTAPAAAPVAGAAGRSRAAVGRVAVGSLDSVGAQASAAPAPLLYTPSELQALIDAESEELKSGRGVYPRLLNRFVKLVPGRNVPKLAALRKTLKRAKASGMTVSATAQSSAWAYADAHATAPRGGGSRSAAGRK